MKLHLGTHLYLWWLADPAQIADEARVAIATPRNFAFVSAAAVVEFAFTQASARFKATELPETMLEACRFRELPLKIVHAAALWSLSPIYKDPFGHLLIAQALAEGLTLVTRDPVMRQYAISLPAA